MECLMALGVASMGLVGVLSVIPTVLRNVGECDWKNRTSYLLQNVRADLRSRSGIESEYGGWVEWREISEKGVFRWRVDSETLKTTSSGNWELALERISSEWWQISIRGGGRSQQVYWYLSP